MLSANLSQFSCHPRRFGWALYLLSLLQLAHPLGVGAQTAPTDKKPDLRLTNQATVSFTGITTLGRRPPNPIDIVRFQSKTNVVTGTVSDRLVDPFGRITGCSGEELTDYTGFNIALYNADPTDPTGASLGRLTPLTTTEFPDIKNNGIPKGLQPNGSNTNPFYLANGEAGSTTSYLIPVRGSSIKNGPIFWSSRHREIQFTVSGECGS
jgi:hypothetical protein